MAADGTLQRLKADLAPHLKQWEDLSRYRREKIQKLRKESIRLRKLINDTRSTLNDKEREIDRLRDHVMQNERIKILQHRIRCREMQLRNAWLRGVAEAAKTQARKELDETHQG